MRLWLKQLWCGFRTGHKKLYRTEFFEGELFPCVSCTSFCPNCEKVFCKTIGCDWGHESFNKKGTK